MSLAGETDLLKPVTWVSGLFLLASIPAFFLLSKKRFVQLLLIGVGLALMPILVLSVMEHLVVPVAIMAGLVGVGGVLFFLGRLWDRYVMKKRCKNIADSVLSDEHPKSIKDKDVVELLTNITKKEY